MKRSRKNKTILALVIVVAIAGISMQYMDGIWEVYAQEKEMSGNMTGILSLSEPEPTQIPETYHFIVEDGVLIKYNGYGGDVTIPDGVTRIGEGVFEEHTNISSITLPDGVTYIGKNAFKGCSMTSINIPESVTGVGVSAFEECNFLTSIHVPRSVTRIENMAFYECSALQQVTFEEGLLVIGDYAFWGCQSLNTVQVPGSVITIGEKAFAKNTIVEKLPPVIEIIKGDMNGNGVIELDDAQIVLKAALKIIILEEEEIYRGDITKDELINLEDAQLVLRYALKIN